MKLAFVALRTILYATGFLWLWAWVAQLLYPFDELLGGALPVWCRAAGVAAMAVGGVVTTWCLCAFVVRGRGTPALFDAPRRLVAWGPYRYVRNPMYGGTALLLLGFGLFQQSPSVVLFVPVWWVLFHLLVVLYEEETLCGKFGAGYEEYCRRTPRWFPRFTRPMSSASAALLVVLATGVHGADQPTNFTGEWKLNSAKSDFGPLDGPDRRTDKIDHSASSLRLTSTQARGDRESIGQWDCRTDGSPCTVTMRGTDLKLSTRVTWDGPVLVFASQGTYSGGDVQISDRWSLSQDGKTLTITRRLSNAVGEAQQTVLLEKQ